MQAKTHQPKPKNDLIRRSSFALTLLMLFISLTAFRQPGKDKSDKKEKIEELRKKFFNMKLSLSDAEQKAFWPVYNEYKQKEKALRDSFRRRYKPNDFIFMDDKQAEDFLNATIRLSEDQHLLYKEYMQRFRKVLPVKKVAMLPMVEREFKKEMMKHARNQAGRGKSGPPGGRTDEPAPDED